MATNPKVLVVDDDPQIHRFLRPSLSLAGYDVLSALNGASGLEMLAAQTPDVILLDLGLPDTDGKNVILQIRTISKVPIIVLSARDQEDEKISSLDLGANDYVNKPFGIGELTARIRTALRRSYSAPDESGIYLCGNLCVDTLKHLVTLDDKPIPCLSGFHPHLPPIVCRHSPEYSSPNVGATASPARPRSDRKALKG